MFRRKSVRKYAPGQLDSAKMAQVVSHFADLKPLFPNIRIELRVMTNAEVRGMFKVEAPHFLAFFSEVKDGYAANAGFMMQQMDLFLSANGIGSCWQGGPKPIRESRAASETRVRHVAGLRSSGRGGPPRHLRFQEGPDLKDNQYERNGGYP